MNKTVKECLGSKQNEEVVVVGILSNPYDGVTKSGKPYADFDLYANGATIQIKIWDMTSKEFLDRKGISLGKPVTVNGSISINPQNGISQICVRDGEIPAAAPYSVPGETVEETLEKLVQATPVTVEKMLASIRLLFENYFPTPEEPFLGRMSLRKLCEWGLEMLESVKTYPYGLEVHKERSGFIAHVYNCCHMLACSVGLPEFDKGIVLAALITYHVGISFLYHVDYETGLIKDVKDLDEYGSLGAFNTSFIISWSGALNEMLGGVSPLIRNYMACINALNGISEPISIESQVAYGIVQNELDTFRIYEAVNGLNTECYSFIKKDGEVRKVFNFS